VAVVQVWLWFVGLAIFSHAMHQLGLMGAPRRTMLAAVLIAIAYGPTLLRVATTTPLITPGLRVW
jgi:heme/copper-type cytochrome/quinol oxidase subunit 1